MSEETTKLHEPSKTNPFLLRLQEILSSFSHSVEGGGGSSLSELVSFLETISGSALAEPGDKDAQNNAFEVLFHIYRFMLSPSLDQETADLLSFELPKAVSKFAGLSSKCFDIAETIIHHFIETCSPRDMLSILCEAMGSTDRPVCASGYVASLLSGLSKVFLSIQRRQYEQVKVAIPIILYVLEATCSELVTKAANSEVVDENEEFFLLILFFKVVDVAESIRTICKKMDCKVNKKLRALLGLYVLQVMSILSFNKADEISRYLHLVRMLSDFYPYCGFSYLALIIGSDVDRMINIVTKDEEDDFISCLSYANHGAALSVIWGQIYDDVAQAAIQNVSTVKDELQNHQTKRWQAIGMLKHILGSNSMPWKLKEHAINFLLWITSESLIQNDEHIDCSIYLPSLCAALEAITKVIIYAPNAELRKNAFEALKKVLADSPTSEIFEIVKYLITNSNSSSMIGILLDIVRGELHKESCQRKSTKKDAFPSKSQESAYRSLWTGEVLELVEMVLRPPKGGPPCLLEDGDAVLAAFNLYRFILMTESSGKTNYTKVLSRNNLKMAYNEWLMPLRILVTGIMAENKNDHDELAVDSMCVLNPVELVLYRCIELVEENLKHST